MEAEKWLRMMSQEVDEADHLNSWATTVNNFLNASKSPDVSGEKHSNGHGQTIYQKSVYDGDIGSGTPKPPLTYNPKKIAP